MKRPPAEVTPVTTAPSFLHTPLKAPGSARQGGRRDPAEKVEDGKMLKRIAAIATLVLLAAACMMTESEHTFYLDPDGSVTWMVVDSNVRSDEEGQKGLDEELAFLDSVDSGEHDTAVMMDECAPLRIDTRLVRDERPYMVVTSGRFGNVADLFQCLFDADDADALVELIRLDGHYRLTINVDVALEDDVEASETEAKVTTNHVDPLPADVVSFFLTEGEFVEAEGFVIDEESRSARPIEFDEKQLEEIVRKGTLVYSLTWTAPAGN
jgi:hypothetical protein